MARRRPSIPRTLFLALSILASASLTLIGSLWISAEIIAFRRNAEALREDLLETRRSHLKTQVDNATAYIEFMRSQTEFRVRETIRQRVYEAHSVATHIYNEYKDTVTRPELERLVREAVRPIRFANGRGYYFATSLSGIEQLFADRPDMEGLDLLGMRDTQGRYVIRDMIEIVKTDGEGFYEYRGTQPDQPGRDFGKISFVKHFEPFDWFFGTGEYLDDTERELKEEALRWISRIRFDGDNYVFVGSYEGVSLAGPAVGSTMIDVTDPNGVPIVKELIRLAHSGGGYLLYVMPRLDGLRPEPKISYSAGVPDWQWYVGAGSYIDDIAAQIDASRATMVNRVRGNVATIVVILIVLLVVVYIGGRRFALRTYRSFDAFETFFHRAARESVEMDTVDLGFVEFERLADSANAMLAQRKETEKAHELMQAQLRQAQKMEAVGQMAGGIAHDFNNLLQVILGNTELALDKLSPADQAVGHVKEIEAAGNRASALVSQILTFSKARPLSPLQILDLNLVVNDLSTMLRRIIAENISVTLEPAPDLWSVRADASQIEQILVNLSVNAQDSMPNGGHIKIRTSNVQLDGTRTEAFAWANPGSYVCLSVADDGAGMSEAVRERAFEPFFTTKDVGRGTGLGLSTAYAIARKHGGLIELLSQPAVGTTVSLYLPAEEQAVVTRVEERKETVPTGGSETVLLAEDEEQVRKLNVTLLTRAGYTVIAAADGDEAVRLYRDRQDEIALAVLDVVMPGKSGPEVAVAIAATNRHLPVLYLSGYSGERISENGLVGNSRLLQKPCSPGELLASVRTMLDQGRKDDRV